MLLPLQNNLVNSEVTGDMVASGSIQIDGTAIISGTGKLQSSGSIIVNGVGIISATGKMLAFGTIIINGTAQAIIQGGTRMIHNVIAIMIGK